MLSLSGKGETRSPMKAWQKLIWFASLVVVVGIVLTVLTHPKGGPAGVKDVILMATASTRGETSPCG